jgi:chemotaxis protein methyltransferase CheR
MNTLDVAYVRQLVREYSAIVLDDSKAYLVEGRLTPLAHNAGFSGPEALVQRLRSEPVGPLHQRVVEALTINETSFFRDSRVFDTIRARILPELLRSRKKVTIWSAACSTGQEPYSIAMLLLEHFPNLGPDSVEIVATDLSEQVLVQARAGRYSQLELSRGLPRELRSRYFETDGDFFRVTEPLQKLVSFRRLNLVGTWPWLPWADLVLLRNVLIYFDQNTRLDVLERIRRSMNPQGFLVLGTSETAIESECFTRVISDGVVTYRISRATGSVRRLPTHRP